MDEEKKDYLITITGKGKRREIHLSAFGFNFGLFVIMLCAFIFIGTCSYSVYEILHYRQNREIISEVQRAGEMQQEQLLAVSKKAANLSETIQNLAQQEEELRIQAGLNKPAREDKISEENIPAENQSEWIPPDAENQPTVEIKSEWVPPDAENKPTAEIKSEWVPPADEIPELGEIAPIEGLPNPEDLPALENIPASVEIPAPETKSEWLPPYVEGAYTGQGGPLPDLKIGDVSEALEMIEQRVAIRLESLDDFQNELKYRREQMYLVAEVPANTTGTFGTVIVENGFASMPNLTLDLGQFGGAPSNDPNMPSIWPTTGVVTSPYGLRWGGTDFHPGIDIANDMGTPIVATADGIVEYAGWNAGGYGNMVDINHGNGLMTRYGHASQVVVTAGQYVKRGQLIAYMGSTGFSTGPHVHYEVHVNGQRVNPISYL